MRVICHACLRFLSGAVVRLHWTVQRRDDFDVRHTRIAGTRKNIRPTTDLLSKDPTPNLVPPGACRSAHRMLFWAVCNSPFLPFKVTLDHFVMVRIHARQCLIINELQKFTATCVSVSGNFLPNLGRWICDGIVTFILFSVFWRKQQTFSL